MNTRHQRNAWIFLAGCLAVGAVLWLGQRREPTPAPEAMPRDPLPRGLTREALAEAKRIEVREQELNRTVWAAEMLAQECGRTIEVLWDNLNASSNKLDTAGDFKFAEMVWGRWSQPRRLVHGIETREPSGIGSIYTTEKWREWLAERKREGWQLEQVEFRHLRFDPGVAGRGDRSGYYFSAHAINSGRSERAVLEGELDIDWAPASPGETHRAVARIDASRLGIKTRRGPPPWELILQETIQPPDHSRSIDPLILYDLDGDGLSEIILAAKNVVYRRQATGTFQSATLCSYPPDVVYAALVADFDGDGAADLLCQAHEGLELFKGSSVGTFSSRATLACAATRHLDYPMVLTCGDIDHDGDLDVYLGQYKEPYERGSRPTPYYDSNDGYPAFLLLNDGHGRFTDATLAAGLGEKRRRRVYSASFARLGGDGQADLVVVSDFAGIDLYRNDGRGHFTDMTRAWAAETKAFGMAHALADFNADAYLDLLVMGMNSPTVSRLDHLGLRRPDATEAPAMRSRMTYGNRLLLGQPAGGFVQTGLNDSIARSGWSWGCAAFDYDNDGFPDVYIGNGMESRRSVRDYEAEFWLHDAYVSGSPDNPAAEHYFKTRFSLTRGAGESYGGHEKNRLYLNQHGKTFLEAAYLLGVGLEQDSRNVVADDLDGNGGVDLLVTTFAAWPEPRQTLRVYKNNARESGHWVGFRFREEGGGRTPVGAQVSLQSDGMRQTRQMVTGDSYRSQQANTVHFGLGNRTAVQRVDISWPNGQTTSLTNLPSDQYYQPRAPMRGGSTP